MAFSLRQVKVVQLAMNTRTGQREDRIVEEHPAVMLLSGKGSFPVWLQDGQAWAENGQLLETLPPWFEEELGKCSPAVLASVGWTQASLPPPVVQTPALSAESNYCGVCEIGVTRKHWGRHLRSKGHVALAEAQEVSNGNHYAPV